MNSTDDLAYLTIAEAGRRFRSGVLRPEALVEALLERIEALDDRVCAWVCVWRDEALIAARTAGIDMAAGRDRGPLHGIPIGVKDLFDVAGQPTLAGAPELFAGHVAGQDAAVVNRLRAAGAVLLGKTQTHPLAMGTITPTTRNPWDLDRVPGGSSGGSAAAVAAGLCVASLGTDTGGSIRQPAAFCGVVGITPTYGRVSRYGLIAFASSLDRVGPFACSVRDAARVLQVLAGQDPLDATSSDRPVGDYVSAVDQPADGLRIGVPKEYFGEGLDPEIRAAIERSLDGLRAAGCEIKPISLPHTRYAIPTYYVLATAEASANLSRFDGVRFGYRAPGVKTLSEMYQHSREEGFGPEVKRRILLGTYALSAGYYDAYYRKAQQVRALLTRDFLTAFNEVDAIVCPVTPTVAFKLGEKTDDPVKMYLEDIYSVAASLAGICAMSVPCGTTSGQGGTEAGLPIGVQIMAPHFAEETMLRIASSIEAGH